MPRRDPVYATAVPGDRALPAQLELRERPAGRQPALLQSWRDLLFLHWRIDPETVARTLPRELEVQTFDGAAWIGLVPFFVRAVRPRLLPPLPYLSSFLELNVRTYVIGPGGRPGVWFYSLDANRLPAVLGARAMFHLPYEHARMSAWTRPDGFVDYTCRRRSPRARTSRFLYRPGGPTRAAQPGSLEFFLVERYLLWAHVRGRLFSGRVHHAAYPLRNVELPLWDAHALELDGLPAPRRPPDHAIYAAGVDVEVFALEPA